MFGQRLALLHLLGLRGDPLLHLLQQPFVFPTTEAARFLIAGAARFQRARPTDAQRRPVIADCAAQLEAAGTITQFLAGGATVTILAGVVDEALFAVEALLGVGAGQRLGN